MQVKSKVVVLFGGIFHLGLKDRILTCFQLLSSQHPKPSVRITNKLILKERLIDSTVYLVYRLRTFDFSHTRGFLR